MSLTMSSPQTRGSATQTPSSLMRLPDWPIHHAKISGCFTQIISFLQFLMVHWISEVHQTTFNSLDSQEVAPRPDLPDVHKEALVLLETSETDSPSCFRVSSIVASRVAILEYCHWLDYFIRMFWIKPWRLFDKVKILS